MEFVLVIGPIGPIGSIEISNLVENGPLGSDQRIIDQFQTNFLNSSSIVDSLPMIEVIAL